MIDLEKIRVHPTMYIRIRKDIPLLSELFSRRQRIAIYYEQSYHEGINDYIRNHYDDISKQLESNYISFIYIPMLLENMDDYLQYSFPDSAGIDIPRPTAEELYKSITEHIVKIPPTGRPMFLIGDYKNKAPYPSGTVEDGQQVFCCYDLDYADDNQFKYALRHYLPPFQLDDDIMFRSGDDDSSVPHTGEEDVVYGYDADRESIEILSEIQERIDKLYAKGIPANILMRLLSLPEPKPSRLLITDDFRLLLPDYNNREIVLNPLPKALYFFYLRHSEGVLFKHLRDHRSELFDLYSLLSPSENLDRMNHSIDDLADSTKNSVNVLCSRIKAAFVSQFKDDLARQYYISGAAGEPKSISLDRKLVEDRSGVIISKTRT